MLIGGGGELEAFPLSNTASNAECRWEADPRELLRLENQLRSKGLRIVGYYHSHPNGSSSPSERDRRAAIPGTMQVIVPVSSAGAGAPFVWQRPGDHLEQE